MRTPGVLLALVMALVAAAPAHAATRLKAFRSCAALVSYARAGAERTNGGVGVVPRAEPVAVTPITAPAPAPAADGAAPETTAVGGSVDISSTNVQEPGVDEPDVVKTDGRFIYAITSGTLRIVDVATRTVKGTLPVQGYNPQLLVRGTRVLVIAGTSSGPASTPMIPLAPGGIIGGALGQTTVTEIDVSDPAAPKVARTMTIDGRFVDARQHGGTARLVVDDEPAPIAEPQDAATPAFVGHTVLKSALSGHTFRRQLAPCAAIRRPARFSGLGVLAILTIDLDRGMYSLDRDGVMAGAQVVYGSADALYVASRRYMPRLEAGTAVPDGVTTEIDRFDISDPDKTTYAAGGSVPGFVLNSYALSEYGGDLRVATTESPPWQPGLPVAGPASRVSVLRQDGTALRTIGSVGDLGKGEQITAVRFIGDRGYVVTFQPLQGDPLYTLDLSNPAAPAVRGRLDLPGYSAYLHPVGGTLLLGIGRIGADVKAELFDVSDPAAPRSVSQLDFGQGATAVERNPHAFLYWPASKLAVMPFTGAQFSGAIALHAGAAPLSEAGRIAAPGQYADIGRTLVIGTTLFTLSYAGLGENDLATLAPTGFTAF